jgi:hypothetical protein
MLKYTNARRYHLFPVFPLAKERLKQHENIERMENVGGAKKLRVFFFM